MRNINVIFFRKLRLLGLVIKILISLMIYCLKWAYVEYVSFKENIETW
jgi:hypothetical protein